MVSAEENIQYLYLVLTHGGNPTIDWDPICAALQLEKGAATKRWSRLKQAMEKKEKPSPSNHEFLWLMLKHSSRDKAIADSCNSTKGACSKRYSRLKIAFEKGDAPPCTSGKGDKTASASASLPAPATPKKTPKARIKTGDKEDTPTATSKRKRTPAKKKVVEQDDEGNEDDQEEGSVAKRVKGTPKAKPKPKNAFRASDRKNEAGETESRIKSESTDDNDNDEGDGDGDVFLDAVEHAAADQEEEEEDEVFPAASTFSRAFANARDIADTLLNMNRKTGLSAERRREFEGMRELFDGVV